MKAGQKKKVYSVEERLAHVAAYNASGKSLVQYAKDNGVNDQTLYNWVKGRNLKTQAKKDKVKKTQPTPVKVDKAPTFGTLPPIQSPTRSERFWAWYDAHPSIALTQHVVLIVLLVLDLIARHK